MLAVSERLTKTSFSHFLSASCPTYISRLRLEIQPSDSSLQQKMSQ